MSCKKLWTTFEVATLERYYPYFGSDASKWPRPIHRSKTAISSYAYKHGIRRRELTYQHIDEKQAKQLIDAWRTIAKHLKVSPRALVGDLCIARKKGLL